MNILITGASKGIGRDLALKFAELDNIKLLLLSRSKDRLEDLRIACNKLNKNAQVEILPYDLENLILEEKVLDIKEEHLDIVINNAGYLVNKRFSDITTEEIIDMTTVNFVAPVILLKRLAKKLGATGNTHIINIGSMGGFQGSVKFPGLSIYSATKAALASFTECMAQEYEGSDVYVNCLALGAVQTEMLSEAFPGYQAPLAANEMAEYICEFALNGYRFFNGKVLPVSVSTP